MPKIGELLDLLADWVPDEAARKRIFVSNAHQLYGMVRRTESKSRYASRPQA